MSDSAHARWFTWYMMNVSPPHAPPPNPSALTPTVIACVAWPSQCGLAKSVWPGQVRPGQDDAGGVGMYACNVVPRCLYRYKPCMHATCCEGTHKLPLTTHRYIVISIKDARVCVNSPRGAQVSINSPRGAQVLLDHKGGAVQLVPRVLVQVGTLGHVIHLWMMHMYRLALLAT